MAGMLQIITYLLAFYLVIKGFEILQISLASNRDNRSGIITLGMFVLVACVIAAIAFVVMQDRQANSLGKSYNNTNNDYSFENKEQPKPLPSRRYIP